MHLLAKSFFVLYTWTIYRINHNTPTYICDNTEYLLRYISLQPCWWLVIWQSSCALAQRLNRSTAVWYCHSWSPLTRGCNLPQGSRGESRWATFGLFLSHFSTLIESSVVQNTASFFCKLCLSLIYNLTVISCSAKCEVTPPKIFL